MKVIKRDGRAVDYDRQKIVIAIGKANNEVIPAKRASDNEIKEIIKYIESLNKKRILVEDIQDIIEEKLMELGKYELAKKYIVYRYTRALVRKANTTDESILGLIRNENKHLQEERGLDVVLASKQRNYIAGEVSRDLTKRLLLPEKITKADQEGVLHFHDADYFIQPIFNCSFINIGDMLDNGTVINGKMIESPKSFQVACNIMTQIMIALANNQYGGQSVDLCHLGKYIRKSYEKFKKNLENKYKDTISSEILEEIVQDRLKEEIKAGVQTIQYQINTLMTAGGQAPFVTLFLHLDENDKYIKENAMIIEEVLRQRYEGIKQEDGTYISPEFPRLTYVLDECNNLSGGKYDYITRLAIKCSIKRNYPDYISAKKMKENYNGNVFSPMGNRNFLSCWQDKNGDYRFEGRFNQGVVTINLPQIGIISDGDLNKFWALLEERMELCREALMCRHYALLGTTSDISPIHWQYGAIARLNKEEKIDELLQNGYSTLSLGYIGIEETTKLMIGTSHKEKDGHDFAVNLIKKMNAIVEKWKQDTGLGFMLYATPSESLGYKLIKIDKERFGTIKGITDKDSYTNSYYLSLNDELNLLDRLKFESEFQDLSAGGASSYISIKDFSNQIENIEEFIQFIYNNNQYVEFRK